MWDIFIEVGTGIVEWLLERRRDSKARPKRFLTRNERARKRRRGSEQETAASSSDGDSPDDRNNVDVLRVGP
jgi:hypothetical protein